MQKANPKSTVAPKVHRLNFGMIRCLFGYSTDAGYIKLIVEISSSAPEAAGRNFPFSSLFAQLLGFSFGFGPVSAFRSPEGICSLPRQDRVKVAADSGALAHSGSGGRERYGMWGKPVVAEASLTLQQPEVALYVLPGKLSLDHRTLAVAGCTGSRHGRCG